MPPFDPPSPCISVCAIDPVTDLCSGCYRTLNEIARWAQLSPEEKQRVLDAITERRAGHQSREVK